MGLGPPMVTPMSCMVTRQGRANEGVKHSEEVKEVVNDAAEEGATERVNEGSNDGAKEGISDRANKGVN